MEEMQTTSISPEVMDSNTREKIGFIMSTHYEIIKLCLSSLSTTCLPSVATVCKAWKHVVQDLREKRTKLQIIPILKEASKYPSSNGPERNISISLIRDTMKPAAGTLPKFCFAVATKQLSNIVGSKGLTDCLESCLPASCCSFITRCEGIICSAEDDTVDVVFSPPKPALAAVTFPETPGITTHIFKMQNRKNCSKFLFHKDGGYKPVDELSRDIISGPVKCALLFATDSGCHACSSSHSLRRLIKKSQTENYAYGGCIVKGMSTPLMKVEGKASGILFCGENLQAASIVITKDDVDSNIEKKIVELKSCNILLKNSVAFMCSCIGRPDLELETLAFTRHFPDTPLIGLIGNGEIGVNYLPKLGAKAACTTSTRKAEHIYSSVIVLLSWN